MMMNQTFNRRFSPNRRKTRVKARLDVEGRALKALILDVSFEGMKIAVRRPLPPGTAVTVGVLGARIPAIVHWYRGGHCGLHLLDRLDGATLRALETAHDELAEYR